MIEILLISTIIVTISVVLLSVRVLIKRGGEFVSQHIHDNKTLRNQGIYCVLEQDKEARLINKKAIKEKSNN